ETDRLDGLRITITTNGGIYDSQVQPGWTVLSTMSSIYNDLGQVTSTTDAAQHTTSYQYDGAGRQTRVTDPLTHSIVTAYDAAGRAILSTDASLHTSQYAYNGDGQ